MEEYKFQGISFDIKILKHIERISGWGLGELVLVEHNNLSFDAYFCDMVISNLGIIEYPGHDKDADKENDKYFSRGKVMEVVAHFHVFGGDKDIEIMPDNIPGSIDCRDGCHGGSSGGEWSITGATISEVEDDTVMLDCGIPVLCTSENRIEGVPTGTILSMTGELQLIPTKGGILHEQCKNGE